MLKSASAFFLFSVIFTMISVRKAMRNRGVPEDKAERRACVAVNKESGGKKAVREGENDLINNSRKSFV